jgi:hypothetical protein
MKYRFHTALAALLLSLAASGTGSPESTYTADGRLKFPTNYREWIFLSSGLDMSYRQRPDMQGHSMFDNVFVDPVAYQAFLRTGTWPEQTLLVLEVRGASDKGSINKSGKFQSTELMGVEVHVKDTKRFANGWAFFGFEAGTEPARQIPTGADCYSCHQQHGAVDTTFVQFYPTLLPIATRKRTLSPGSN